MKNYFKPITAPTAVLLLFQSCSMDEDRLNNQASPADKDVPSGLLMISEQEFISASMTEPLSQEKHPGFYTAALAEQIRNAAPAKNLSDAETAAPLMDIEDIPVWRDNKRTIKVYENGEMEMENEFPLYEEFMQNTLIKAVENVADIDQTVSKSVYSGSMMYLYNHKGELLHSMTAQMPDFSSLIDSAATQQIHNAPLTKSGDVPDINAIRERIQHSSGDALSITRLDRNSDGSIILEQVSQDGGTQIHTLLSEDLTKTYSRSIFKNGQLQSRSFSYYAQDSKNFSTTLSRTGSDTPQPCTTVTQTLIVKNGVPRIHSEYNYYTRNTTVINR